MLSTFPATDDMAQPEVKSACVHPAAAARQMRCLLVWQPAHLCDGVVVQLGQVTLSHVTAVAWLAAGDEVVAVVQLVVGVPASAAKHNSYTTRF
jgi:hypothetical protein